MTKFTTQSICIYETLIRERRFGTSLCPPLIESIQSTLQNSNNNSLTLWCPRIIFTTHLHTFLFRNICDKSAQNLIMKGWLLQVWLCISNDTLPERITCMLRKSWVISSFDSKILWKNLYQFWGHRLWTLAFAPGISSSCERPVFHLGAVGALHQPCIGHLDFWSNVNSLLASSTISSAESASKMESFPLVHPCIRRLWLLSTEKNLGLTSSFDARLCVDSTSWF